MQKIRIALIVGFLAILFIFSISLIVGGATQFRRAALPIYLYERNCTLTNRDIVYCPNGYMGVWDNRAFVIDDVFSIQPTTELAELSIYRGNGTTYLCLCRNGPPSQFAACDVWAAQCYLNIESTRYVQMTANVFKYGSDVMIAIGSLLLTFLIVFAVAMCRNKKDPFVYLKNEMELK